MKSYVSRKVDVLKTLNDCDFISVEQKEKLREQARDWLGHQQRKMESDGFLDFLHRHGAYNWVVYWFGLINDK